MSEINKNPDGSYMSEDQILADLPNRVKDAATLDLIRGGFEYKADSEAAKKCAEIGINLAAYERSQFGQWIRNSYGLWREDNPHTVINPTPNAEGIIDHPLHPDNMSGRIIRRFVEKLQAEASA